MSKAHINPPSILPERQGVYRTRLVDPETDQPEGDWGYSYFDTTDRIWGCQSANRDTAFGERDFEFATQVKQWCKLDEDPTA